MRRLRAQAHHQQVFLRVRRSFLAAAQIEIAAQIQAPATPCRWAASQVGLGGEAAFADWDCARPGFRARTEHRIAQKFELLVIVGGESLAVRASLANEVWISARRNNSWLEKWYPILDFQSCKLRAHERSRYLPWPWRDGAGPDALAAD